MIGCRPFSETEVLKIKSRLDKTRDLALFILGVKSGFRISELLSLKVSDVFQFGVVVDRIIVARRHMKKQTKSRSVLLHPEAKEAVLKLIKADELKPHHYLFKSRKGANSPMGRIQAWRILKKASRLEKLSGNIGTHSMRKTFADRMYDKLKRDLLRMQIALGHKSIQSTVDYLSFRQEDIDAAILEI
jgi:integrase